MARAWSLRFMIIRLLYSLQHLMQHGHLYREAVARFVLHDAAIAVEHLVSDRGIAAYRQAVHEAAVGGSACEPAIPHAPIGKRAAQQRIACRIAVGIDCAPFLGIHDICTGERILAVARLAYRAARKRGALGGL